jgi:thiamine biosynthesis lipoprotein
MFNFIKYFLITLLLVACQGQNPAGSGSATYTTIEGQTMGTYFRVTSDLPDVPKSALDSILVDINQAVSTYIDDAQISLFNQSENGITIPNGYFRDNFEIASFFYTISQGYYDPTVMPLVNYWGFGYEGKKRAAKSDSLEIEKIIQYIGLKKINTVEMGDSLRLIKENPNVELDFSSVAKGYAVDVLSHYLERKGAENYLVDIGGEMRLKGKNPRGQKWSIGINTPKEGAALNDAIQYLSVSDKGLATSGNYRNFYEVDGQKISHTINPKTGFPERSYLLSTTILAENCALADAWATTAMVLGLEKATELIQNYPEVSACLIYNKEDELEVSYVNNFEKFIVKK